MVPGISHVSTTEPHSRSAALPGPQTKPSLETLRNLQSVAWAVGRGGCVSPLPALLGLCAGSCVGLGVGVGSCEGAAAPPEGRACPAGRRPTASPPRTPRRGRDSPSHSQHCWTPQHCPLSLTRGLWSHLPTPSPPCHHASGPVTTAAPPAGTSLRCPDPSRALNSRVNSAPGRRESGVGRALAFRSPRLAHSWPLTGRPALPGMI